MLTAATFGAAVGIISSCVTSKSNIKEPKPELKKQNIFRDYSKGILP